MTRRRGYLNWIGMLLCCAAPVSAQELTKVINAQTQKAWQKDKVSPAPLCDDSAFLRRVYLDLVGTIPTYEEAKAFLESNDSQKRLKVIDKLLDDPRFGPNQANVWDMVFFGRNPPNGESVRKRDDFKKWLAAKFQKNVPFDQFARDFLAGEEESALFYVQFGRNVEDTTQAVSRIFMGTQIGCARCHDHPFEPLTQKDFYGMAGFFVRLVTLEAGTMGNVKKFKLGEKSTGDVLFTGSVKTARPGQKGEPVKPKFLGGDELKEPTLPANFKEVEVKGAKSLPKPVFSRKEQFINWLAKPENPFFTKAVVNRVWAQFMGRGFVHPVDDLSDKNLPNIPELFDAACTAFVSHKYDLKWLIREIVRSDAYQLSDTGEVTDAFPSLHERARVRPLSAEEMLAALVTATNYNGDSKEEMKLPTNGVEMYMIQNLGEPNNGRGEFQASLSEHLFMNNAGQITQVISPNKKGTLADYLQNSKDSWEAKVDRLYLSVLTRLPRAEEKAKFVEFLANAPKGQGTSGRDSAVRDAIWVLINCAEFRFNH
jgi:hypothetical protein